MLAGALPRRRLPGRNALFFPLLDSMRCPELTASWRRSEDILSGNPIFRTLDFGLAGSSHPGMARTRAKWNRAARTVERVHPDQPGKDENRIRLITAADRWASTRFIKM